MSNTKVKFTFPPTHIKDPIIWELGHQFEVITNIRRAEVGDDVGWVILELTGTEEQIETGLNWVRSKGVRVDPLGGDVLEG